jgi:hypothetical protein
MRYQYRLVSAMRRSERDYVWPGLELSFTTAASRFHQLVKSASRAIKASSGHPNGDSKVLEKLWKDAGKPDSWWQISYNAACGYASTINDQQDKAVNQSRAGCALDLLEQTLVHPGVYQLTSSWVRKDPDLEPISKDGRFGRFADQLRTGA